MDQSTTEHPICKPGDSGKKSISVEQMLHECVRSHPKYSKKEKALMGIRLQQCFSKEQSQKEVELGSHLKGVDRLMNLSF